MTQEIIKFELPEPEQVEAGLKKLQHYQAIVQKTLIKDLDYGVIPGTTKPTLLKPGAEKLAKIHGLADEYEILEKIEDWDKPFFHYLLKCRLRHISSGIVVSEGTGSCNSKENKYRWRWVKEKEIDQTKYDPADLMKKVLHGQYGEYTLYRIDNDDIFTQVNTLLKMAQKRAMVNAVLSACRLSAVFTQDLEDMKEIIEAEKSAEKIEKKPAIQPPQTKKITPPKPKEIEEIEPEELQEDMITIPQSKKIHALMGQHGFKTREQRLKAVNTMMGLNIETSKDLTKEQASALIDLLEGQRDAI